MSGVKNISRILEASTEDDRIRGMRAWEHYRKLTSQIAAEYGFTAEIGAAVFAAISPNNDYFGNLRDTRRVLEAVRAGKQPASIKISTYNPNKEKAFKIANGGAPLDLIIAPKTRSFFLNINNPTNPEPVTVDGHMFNIWHNKRMALGTGVQRLDLKMYTKIANGVRKVAYAHGLVPNQVQAIVWHAWRRIHQIKYTTQIELWQPDAIYAGIGFIPVETSGFCGLS